MIKRLHKVLFLFFLLGNGVLFAQQDPYYSHFMINKLNYNPAFAGADKKGYMCANMIYHNQWSGWEGSPVTQSVNFNASMFKNLGIGFSVENDKQGFETTLNPKLSLAYGIKLGASGSLRIGAYGGFMQKGLAGDKLKPLSQILGTGNDPSVPTSAVSALKPDFGAGLYYTNTNFYNLYVGLSSTHLAENKFEYSVGATGSVFSTSRRHMYMVAGAEYPMGNLVLYPSLLFKYDFTKTQIDLNIYAEFNNKFGAAVAYRNDQFRADALTLMGRYKVLENNNSIMYAGYSYDLTLSKVGPFAGNSYGTHEVMVSYCFKIKTKTKTPTEYIKRDTRHLGSKKTY